MAWARGSYGRGISTGVRLIEDDDRFDATVAKVVAFIASPGRELELPLDL